MKTSVLFPLLGAVLALFLGPLAGLAAEESAAPLPQEAPAVAPEAPASPEAPEITEEPDKSGLRRLDIEELPEAAQDAAATAKEEANAARAVAEEEEARAKAEAAKAEQQREDESEDARRSSRRHNGDARVLFWGDATLAEGESTEALVSIIGSSTAAGEVREAVVSILGSSTSSGDTHGSVVSIIGSSRVTGGRVGDVVVSVLGSTYVNAHVRGEVVAVLGNLELGPQAVIDGDLVCVGGALKLDKDAVVHGETNHFGFGGHFDGFVGLHAWIDQCLKYGRPLAFGPNLMWAWWIAIGFLLMYIFLAALFARPVQTCLRTLEQRPGYSLLTALLVTLITPLAAILLLFTVVGAPALALFLLVAGLFGKMVMTAWIGSLLTRLGGDGPLSRPAISVLVGGVIVLGLYTVPVVGFLVAKLLSWIGLGVVVYTIVLSLKRNRVLPATAMAGVPAGAIPVVPPTVPRADVSSTGVASAGFTGAAAAAGGTATAPFGVPPVVTAHVIVSAATLHRAGFWIRIAASALDALLVAVAVNLLPNILEPNFLLAYAAYCIVLWALKGTTIGGIVCNLKVVRLNDQPVDWSTALVRALGGFLSLFAAGIGFIWVAFDDQRQSWHDKIAGTTVVHVPKGVSLV